MLEGEISQEVFDKSQAYGRAKAKFGFISGLYTQIQSYSIIYFDLLPRLWALTGVWLADHGHKQYQGEIVHTLIFFFTFNIINTVLDLPISWYSTFVLEEKYGFNKQTPSLFITDMLKQQGLMIAFGAPLLSGFLAIIQKTGNSFFYYLWLFSVGVQVFAITIYPIAILPLFNKLTPLQEGPLKTQTEALAKRLDFPLSELYVIDGSKRSAHSNAYFYGLPWKKHIVIYDTLIEKSETEEVVAVLGHELGHWKLGHTTKLLGIAQFHMFYIFALFSVFINNRSLYQSFGFHKEFPIIIGFILFSDALAPMDTVVKLLMNILSRNFEFQAGLLPPAPVLFSALSPSIKVANGLPLDKFAKDLGYQTNLAKSLIKLQIQNLSTMDADWMFASYHFSHPILPERLGALGWTGKKVDGDEKAKDSSKAIKASDREL